MGGWSIFLVLFKCLSFLGVETVKAVSLSEATAVVANVSSLSRLSSSIG